MANINDLPPTDGGNFNYELISQVLISLLRDLTLNRNFFTTDLGSSEENEILDAYGYSVHKKKVRGEGSIDEVSVALPKELTDKEAKDVLSGIKTHEDAYDYFPKVVLERENRKLYVKLMKKMINDNNS